MFLDKSRLVSFPHQYIYIYVYIYHGWCYDFWSVQSTISVIYNVSLYRIVYVVYYIFTFDLSICLFMYIYIYIYLFSHSYIYIYIPNIQKISIK